MDYIGRRARLHRNAIALIDAEHERREIRYGEWSERVNRTAAFLHHELGVRKGARVAVLSENNLEYLDVWMAAGKLGAVLQNLNYRLSDHELAALISDAKPSVLFHDVTFAVRASALSAKVVEKPVVLSLSELARAPSRTVPEVDVSLEDPWVVCYTGGSTGLPKGVVLSHRAQLSNAIGTHASWGLDASDRALLNAPLFHVGGLSVFTFPLVIAGGASIVCSRFDVNQVFELLEERALTVCFAVPTMFLMMQEDPRFAEVDLSPLKIVIAGGAPCPPRVFERFFERGVDFRLGYGLTEAGPNNFWLPRDQVRNKAGKVGYPVLHVDAKIVDPEGRECEANVPGELVLHGPHMAHGYYGQPEVSAAAFHTTPSDPLGRVWLHTGDVAVRDEDGCFSIVDRLKSMIISGGENVYPAEVEAVLHACPAVAEAAVTGIADEKWGEIVHAFIVLRAGHHSDAQALIRFCRERLAGYKLPRSVQFIEALPKTGAGKLDRPLLKTLAVRSG